MQNANEDFDIKPDAKIVSRHLYQINLGLLSYFEAGRRWRNRSLLNVNEDFEAEQDAKRVPLAKPTIIPTDNFGLLSYFEAARRG